MFKFEEEYNKERYEILRMNDNMVLIQFVKPVERKPLKNVMYQRNTVEFGGKNYRINALDYQGTYPRVKLIRYRK